MVKSLVLEAIRKNELVDYLEGKGIYKIEISKWVNTYAPTDWSIIIPKGLYEVSCEYPELQINLKLEEALLKMMEGEPFEIFVALSVFYIQLVEENRGHAPFLIDKNRILEKLRQTLSNNEQSLKSYYGITGMNYKDSIWGEVIRIDMLCRSKWNLSVLL